MVIKEVLLEALLPETTALIITPKSGVTKHRQDLLDKIVLPDRSALTETKEAQLGALHPETMVLITTL